MKTIDWLSIERFIGYGRADAPVVFLGMEEGLAGASLESDLLKRSSYKPLKALEPTGTRLVPTWGPMCELMLRRKGLDVSTENKRAYQLSQLGSPNGDSLLAELLPYPKRTRLDWPEVYIQRGFATQAEYIVTMLPNRQAYLSRFLAEHQRELIVFYGKEHTGAYRALLPGCGWQTQGVFSTSQTGFGRAVIAPHFTSVSFAKNREQFFDLCLN
jgi:hypothetical protein